MTSRFRRGAIRRSTEPSHGTRATALLLDEHQRIALGIGDRGERRAAGNVEGLAEHGAAQVARTAERCPQVAHLDVERHAAAVAAAQVPARPGLGPTEPWRDLHEGTIA